MGGAKALLELDGATLVEHHVARLSELGCTSIAVVARPDTAAVVQRLLLPWSEARVQAAITSSQAESLAAGLRALDADLDPDDVVVVTPVDMLPPSLATHRTLLAHLAEDTRAVTPTHDGRGGHPVVTRRSVLAAYDAGASAMPSLREVLAGASVGRRRVEVADPRVLGDLDTPADVRALRAGSRRACQTQVLNRLLPTVRRQ